MGAEEERRANLERKKKQKSFDRVKAAVNEIAHEKIVCIGNVASDFK